MINFPHFKQTQITVLLFASEVFMRPNEHIHTGAAFLYGASIKPMFTFCGLVWKIFPTMYRG